MSFFNCNLAGSAGESGGTVVEELAPVLLWENPNPSAVFEAQTISLELSEYTGVIIEGKDLSGSEVVNRVYVKKGDSDKFCAGLTEADNSNATNAFLRGIVVNDSGVVIGKVERTGTGNGYVPLNIYGVRTYVVEVEQSKPVTTGSYQVVEGYTSISNYGNKSYLDVLTNETITGSIADKTIIGSGDDIIITTFANRAGAGKDVGQPFTSANNVKLIPLINGDILNNYIPCKGSGANEEAGGYSSIAILVADDSSKPFSVSGKDGAWTSSSLFKLSKVV